MIFPPIARCSRLAWAIAAAGVSASAQGAQPAYTLTDIGFWPGYTNSYAFDVNDSGLVAAGSSPNKAFLYDGAGLVDLGTPLVASNVVVRGINNGGDVVGLVGTYSLVAALWRSDGSKATLGTLGGAQSAAWGINDSGRIAGSANNASGAARAVAWDRDGGAGSISDLGTLGGSNSYGIGISSAGDIAGYSQVAGNTAYHATVFHADGTKTDLGTLGGVNSYANAINEVGLAAGDSQITGSADRHAAIFDIGSGAITDLGTLGGTTSYSYAINDAGVVVGQSQYGSSSSWHAFVYRDGSMQDLNELIDAGSGWVLTNAYGLNESGQIVGMGVFEGRNRAFLLTPVPEPASWALLLAGVAVVGAVCRRAAVGGGLV